MNGSECTLVTLDAEGLWKVQLDNGSKKKLKPENIEAIPPLATNDIQKGKKMAKEAKGVEDRRRLISNLVLTIELSSGLLHHSAWVVCKREWRVGHNGDEGGSTFVATWALGWWLRQTQLML